MDYCFYILACFVVGLLVLICVLAFLAFVRPKRQRFSVRGKHAFITGKDFSGQFLGNFSKVVGSFE